jgi:leucyl aminopeptidase (aminopeptidase T)
MQKDAAYKGARRALTECIPLQRGETLAIFYDDKTREFASLIASVARELELLVDERLVSADLQVELARRNRLEERDQEAIDGARAVIISLGSVDGALAYRRRLLDRAVDESRFVGLVPNATPELLAHGVDIDYDMVQQRCDDLAVALMAGDHAEVITGHPRNGSVMEKLSVFLGRFDRPPITSTGIIQRGAWGNLPGGETFIAPLEGRAQGTYVLNGAFKGHVIDPDNPLLLTFDAGALVGVDGPAEKREPFLQLLHWKPEKDPCSHLELAELGIGVNEGLFELTGHALFDEKMHGTIHIAVGENQMFGGRLTSFLHEDFISRKPTLRIDGHTILDRGRFALDPNPWRESLESVPERGKKLSLQQFEVARSGVHANCSPDGMFRVRRDVGSQRKCVYTVGDGDVSPLLCRLWNLIPEPSDAIALESLKKLWQPAADGDLLLGLIAILRDHHVIECLQPDDSATDEFSWQTLE